MKYITIFNGAILKTLMAAAIATGVMSTPSQSEELTISMWGGFYGENWKKDVIDPWVEKTGIKVTMDFGRSGVRLAKSLATKGRNADLIFLTDHQMAILKERGLLEPVDYAKIPNAANLYDFAKDPLGDALCPASTVLGVGLIYNKDHFDTPPSSWLDLRRSDLKARTAFMDIGFSVAPSVMLHLAKLQGGDADNMDSAFKLISDQKETAKFFQLFEVIDWVNQEEVSLAPMLNIFAKEDQKLPLRFVYPDDGMLGVVNMSCILKGSPNKATAEKFLQYYLSKEVQEMQASRWGEGPVVKNASNPTVSKYKMVPTNRIDELIVYDPVEISRHLKEWFDRFEEEIVAK
jgi:putative spermidine/putrescine transport system substrate-binding protein